MTQNNQSPNRDEWLAHFADQALGGEVDDLAAAGSDPEMRALAEIILRLKHAFPKEQPNAASMKRIQAGVLSRWRAEEQKKARRPQFLRMDWLSQFRRPQFAAALAMVVLAAILIVAVPYLFAGGASVAGVAGAEAPLQIIVYILLGVLIAAAVWYLRRKS